MAVLRTFVALPLPEIYQKAMAEIVRRWSPRLKSKMSWTKHGNWHMTLKFLGDTPEESLPDIKKALESIEFKPFAFRAGNGGFFPPLAGRRPTPRVMWVGCQKGKTEAASLAAAVENVLEPLGYKRERRPFSPHLTVARVKRAEADPWQEIMEDLAQIPWPELTIDRFELLQSVLGPKGPAYSPLAEIKARG
jgi:2'-5' RNA ligase